MNAAIQSKISYSDALKARKAHLSDRCIFSRVQPNAVIPL